MPTVAVPEIGAAVPVLGGTPGAAASDLSWAGIAAHQNKQSKTTPDRASHLLERKGLQTLRAPRPTRWARLQNPNSSLGTERLGLEVKTTSSLTQGLRFLKQKNQGLELVRQVVGPPTFSRKYSPDQGVRPEAVRWPQPETVRCPVGAAARPARSPRPRLPVL